MMAETKLTARLWCLLDSLVDGQQPFDRLFPEYAAGSPSATPADLQTDLAYLQAIGLVSVSEFSASPSAAQGAPGLAAPPGAAIELTAQGEAEWDDARYEPYWQDSPPSPSKPFTFPRRVQYSLAGLCLLLSAIAVWGFLQATWSMAGDTAVNLGACLKPIRATLAAAGAPADVLTQLDAAGQAGLWRSEAVARLQQAAAGLKSMRAASAVAGAQADLERLMNSCRPDAPCQCGAPGR
jgi:hypothetical protein